MSKSDVDESELTAVARRSIEAFLTGRKFTPPESSGNPDPRNPNGIFVTLWSPGGQLRGCIGRHHRAFEQITDEVADCAILSASEDPRFPPVSEKELPGLSIEISLLEKPEPVADPLKELDPKVYGAIVESGFRKATLLPDIEGVETVDQQMRIILRKAGIPEEQAVGRSPVRWYRFKVRKIIE